MTRYSRYRGDAGQWAFLLHRISGVLVFAFLLLHVVDVALIGIDRELFNDVHRLYGNVLLRIFEIGLLAALVFHALNGLRVIAIDFVPGAIRFQRALFSSVLFVTTLATVVGGYIILLPFLEGRVFG